MELDPAIVAAIRVNADNLALGNEVVVVEGGRLIRNTRLPNIWDANHVDSITASSEAEIAALIARAEQAYAHSRHLRFDIEPRTPPELEAKLVNLDGFGVQEGLLMLLKGEPQAQARKFEIQQIQSNEQWSSLETLVALDWDETSRRRFDAGSTPEPEVGTALYAAHRSKSPPVRFWLAYIDGMPRGYLSSWEGNEGVGQVEALFVQEEFRHRGLATALLLHCIADCRLHGAGPVCLVADPTDTPQHMYAAMGFRPVAVLRSRIRHASAAGAND